MLKPLIQFGRVGYKIFKYVTVVGDVVDVYDMVNRKRKAKEEKVEKELTTLRITDFRDLDEKTMCGYKFEIRNITGMMNGKVLKVVKDGETLCGFVLDNFEKENILKMLNTMPFTIEFVEEEE